MKSQTSCITLDRLFLAYCCYDFALHKLALECHPIPEAVKNEDDLDDVPVAGHEEGKF